MNDIENQTQKRKRRDPAPHILPTAKLSTELRLRDRLQTQEAEIARLRTLLYGEGKIRALYDRWRSDIAALEEQATKAKGVIAQGELLQRARKLKLRADELGTAAGFVK